MQLTPAQLPMLKAAILADPVLANLPLTSGSAQLIATEFNKLTEPAFKVWRTSVSRADIYNNTSSEGTNWSWTTYKAQAATEQNAWTQMFMGDQANFAQTNLRAGVSAIFGAANAQTAHVLATAKRSATRAEQLFANGLGTVSSPANLSFEGVLSSEDVQLARELA